MTSSKMRENGAKGNDSVRVTEVLGTGAEAHRLARVGDWTFMVRESDKDREPLVSDEVLAQRLGFDRPRKIKDMIRRHIADGNINPFAVRTTVGQTSGGRPGTLYCLDEADALFIVTRSETTKAVALTKEMIRVYMLARRGLMPAAPKNLGGRNRALAAENASLRAELSAIAMQSAKDSALGAAATYAVLDPLKKLAERQTGERWPQPRHGSLSRALRSARSGFEQELRDSVGWHCRRWDRFPAARVCEVAAALDLVSKRLDREGRMAARARQHPLPGV
jgi:hypothetical protein